CFDPTNHRICHKVDIFALGVLMAEMLSGLQPWGGWAVLDVARSVVQGQRPPLLVGLPLDRRPARLIKLISACWEQDPLRRPEAAEVARELLALQQRSLLQEQGQGQELQSLARTSETGSIAITLDLSTLPPDSSVAGGRAIGETW
ncbi:putative serine/threonine-protein kinase, partial [Tetrabaena socialis]